MTNEKLLRAKDGDCVSVQSQLDRLHRPKRRRQPVAVVRCLYRIMKTISDTIKYQHQSIGKENE